MLEQLALLRLKQTVAHDRNALAEVLTRLVQSREAQQVWVAGLDAAAVCTERQVILRRQSADLTAHLARLGVRSQLAATPFIQYLRDAVGDGSTLTTAQKYVFIDFVQVEVIALLDMLVEALARDARTAALLQQIRAEEILWQRWVRTQPEFLTSNPAVKTRFERLFAEARLHAVAVFMREGLSKYF